jgi:hypothetical protein
MNRSVFGAAGGLPLAVAAGLLLTLGAAACGQPSQNTTQSAPTVTTAPTPTTSPKVRYTLTVVNTFVRTGGPLWSEGALLEVALESAAGTSFTKLGSFDSEMTFDDLEPGRYIVRPAARPCDGNCGYLDARTGECQAVVQVPPTARLTVQHTVGRPCAIRTLRPAPVLPHRSKRPAPHSVSSPP